MGFLLDAVPLVKEALSVAGTSQWCKPEALSFLYLALVVLLVALIFCIPCCFCAGCLVGSSLTTCAWSPTARRGCAALLAEADLVGPARLGRLRRLAGYRQD